MKISKLVLVLLTKKTVFGGHFEFLQPNRKYTYTIKGSVPYSRTNLIIRRLNFENISISFRAMREQQTDRHTYIQTDRQTDRQTELKYYIRYPLNQEHLKYVFVIFLIRFKSVTVVLLLIVVSWQRFHQRLRSRSLVIRFFINKSWVFNNIRFEKYGDIHVTCYIMQHVFIAVDI